MKETNKWVKGINKQFDERKKEEMKLSPSKGQMRYINDFGGQIQECTQRMEMASIMAHDNLITFELAQRIIDHQKDEIQNAVKYLQGYMGVEN